MDSRPLSDYTAPITGGLTPQPDGTGALSPERARRLHAQLRELDTARRRAWLESRRIPVGNTKIAGWSARILVVALTVTLLAGCGPDDTPAPMPVPTTFEAPQPSPTPSAPWYPDCAAVRAAGAAPLSRESPGYRPALDRNRDGVACE